MSRRIGLAGLALALALAVSGCGVSTRVMLTVAQPGRGTVAVSVTLDRAALAAVGGLARLKSEVSVGDLRAAGWTVTGPMAVTAGGAGNGGSGAGARAGATVSVSHGFNSFAEAQALVSEVAGPNVFQIQLKSHRSFWHTSFQLTGLADLTCGVDCFGDGGLRTATGSLVGVDASALSAGSSQKPADVFMFQVEGRLPGQGGAGPTVWKPVLGQKMFLAATSQTLNRSSVVEVASGVAAVIVAMFGYLFWRFARWLRRRFRPHHEPQHRRRKGETQKEAEEPVTPSV